MSLMHVCHACQKVVDLGVSGAAGRRDECPHCRAPLHCCLNCHAYDESMRYGCREPAEADMDVRVATSPVRGLEIAERQELDLVISDQRMPQMDGLAFLARVRDRRPRAHRILLTAYPEMEVALRAINEGLVYRFVLKPWDLDDMRVSVRRAVEAKRLADAHESMAAKLSAQFDELVRAERLATIGRLSAGVGHELANAATPLLMNAQWLGEEVVRLRELFRACAQAVAAGFPAEALENLTVLTGRMQERN